MHSGQNLQWKKMASSAKYIRERRRGFGKIHYEKIDCGQKTMKEKRIQGKIDWTKAERLRQNALRKNVFWAKYN